MNNPPLSPHAPEPDRPVSEELVSLFTIVGQLGQLCDEETDHARQVTELALRLFDRLAGLHGLGSPERTWLKTAALLHDIGWIQGVKRHHKATRDIILATSFPQFSEREKTIIALTARYHRKGLPRNKHKHYGRLDPSDRAVVRRLAAMLRIADGLDRTHRNLVQDVACAVSEDKVVLTLTAGPGAEGERLTAKKKADLFEGVLKREVVIH